MTIDVALGLAALLSYLLGSISFAIVVSRLRGLADPRSYGSNNPGATNVLRSGDKLAAALTLFGDVPNLQNNEHRADDVVACTASLWASLKLLRGCGSEGEGQIKATNT